MKRKSFKKALAGISAAAMLVSAMPMTLIADAYSYTNIFNYGEFKALKTELDSDSGQTGSNADYSYKATVGASGTLTKFTAPANVDLEHFDVRDYARYQINEVFATENNNGKVTTTFESAEYAWDDAAADFVENGAEFIKAVTFEQDSTSANYGKIKTITLSMPVNNAGVNAGVETTEYKDIEFTVARTGDDILEAFQGTSSMHIILANNIDMTLPASYAGGVVPAKAANQLTYGADIDINLNGKNLTTYAGIQVLSKKMRIWGGNSANATISSKDALSTKVATLAAFGSNAFIELYDNVTISNLEDGAAGKAAISGTGTLIMCGDNVIVQHGYGDGKAIDIDNFVAGDYLYKNGTTGFSNLDADLDGFDSHVKENPNPSNDEVNVYGLQHFVTMKIHNYNKWGFEVKDRSGDFSKSTNYLDVDPKTHGDQYGYEPVRNEDGNGIALSGDNQTVKVQNEGQLFFLAQQINDNKFKKSVTAKLENTEFDFNNAPAELSWTPIDASEITLSIDGKFKDAADKNLTKYSVIKNMEVKADSGNAGFVSDTKTGVRNTIENLGFENVSVTGTFAAGNESAGVVVGRGDSVTIQKVYVNNTAAKGAVKGAKYNGTIAGSLYNCSIDHTYSAADVEPVGFMDTNTMQYLVKDGKQKAEYYTNFYDKDLATSVSVYSSDYIVGETSEHFTNGTVAFMLNGHNPEQEVASNNLHGFYASTTTYDTSCSVDANALPANAPYDKTYDQDVFGQDLSSTGKGVSYPTFIEITNEAFDTNHVEASNRVFREIETTCLNEKTAWDEDHPANFLNEEVDSKKGGHTDNDKNDVCDTCGAYKITEKNFDAVLIPYLKDNRTAHVYTTTGVDTDKNGVANGGNDGWLTPKEIGAVTKVVIDLTKADSTKTVDQIIGQIYSTTAANKLKGWDILNSKMDTADNKKLVANGAPVVDVRFVVSDSVVCRLDDTGANDVTAADAIKKGFLVASGFAADKFTTTSVTNATGMNDAYNVDSKVDTRTLKTVAGATANVNSFYVSANQDKTITGASDRNNTAKLAAGMVAYPTASFKDNAQSNSINYTVIFTGGVRHNEFATDKDTDGTYASVADAASVSAKVVAVNNLNSAGTDPGATHSYVGVNCDCVLASEECTVSVTSIACDKHQIGCTVCGHTDASAVDHDFEALFTVGNVTVKRCIGCGYVTATKDTSILASTPTLSKPKSVDALTGAEKTYWRQTYDFSLTAGDNTIVSYGVLYKKIPTDSKAIRAYKLTDDSTGTYFNNTTNMALNTDVLDADGVGYTVRKGIKTNGTYRVNVDMANSDEAVQIVGYVIYKASNGSYFVKTTALTNNTFYDLAKAEMEACNFVVDAGDDIISSKKHQFRFTYDFGEKYTIEKLGVLATRNSTNRVTDKTVYTDGSPDNKITEDIYRVDKTYAPSVKSVKYGVNVTMKEKETATIRGYAVITDEYELKWDIYSDVLTYTNPVAAN